jgi:hypothetical protein
VPDRCQTHAACMIEESWRGTDPHRSAVVWSVAQVDMLGSVVSQKRVGPAAAVGVVVGVVVVVAADVVVGVVVAGGTVAAAAAAAAVDFDVGGDDDADDDDDSGTLRDQIHDPGLHA